MRFTCSANKALLLTLVITILMSRNSAHALIGRARGKASELAASAANKIAGSSPSEVDGGENKKRKSRRARIKNDEKVVFFPTAARRSEDGTGWDIPIHGWIFEPETTDLARRALMTSLRKYIGLSRHDEATKILKRRVGSFLVDNESRKELSVQIGCDNEHGEYCRIFKLPKSQKNGHFEAMLNLDDNELEDIPGVACDQEGVLRFKAVMEDEDERVFEGVAQMIPPTGISVISDIDDTVKITGVGDKKKLLKSTFMEEFKVVPGMAELYQDWAKEFGCKFHFVSSSPWQLWEELAAFLQDVGFPQATYHLKPIRIKDRTLFNLWKCPLETKIAVIESILMAFPERKFVLVGDTGEKDPEVYGEIARRYPKQIHGIYVRNVTGETGQEERYDEAWCGVNRETCALFNKPADIKLDPALIASYKAESATSMEAVPVQEDALKP